MQNDANCCDMSIYKVLVGMGWVIQGWGESCRGGVGHTGMEWVMQGWGGVGCAEMGWVMQGWDGLYRGGMGHAGVRQVM